MTKKIAALLAQEIVHSHLKFKNAFIIALKGELGSGKTTFIQGFAKGLGIKQRLISPTFLLIRKYKLKTKNYKFLYHIDCYRIKNFKELKAIDFEKILKNSQNIVLIEWADKIKKFLPPTTIWLKFKYGQKENERFIRIKPF